MIYGHNGCVYCQQGLIEAPRLQSFSCRKIERDVACLSQALIKACAIVTRSVYHLLTIVFLWGQLCSCLEIYHMTY